MIEVNALEWLGQGTYRKDPVDYPDYTEGVGPDRCDW